MPKIKIRNLLNDGWIEFPQLTDPVVTSEVRAAASAGLKLYDDAGTAGLFVQDGGNVGIGTTEPIADLQVNECIRIDDDGAGAGSDTHAEAPALYIGSAAGGGQFQYNANSGLDLWQFDGSWGRTVTFQKDGNTGIGDTTPDHKLDVAGNIGLDASGYINWGDTDGTSGYGFYDNSGTLQLKNSGGAWEDMVLGSLLAGTFYTETEVDTIIAALAASGVPESRTLTAGSYLLGGGDLSANRRFDVDASALAGVGLPDVAGAGYALVSDGANSWAADQTPTWTGKHTFKEAAPEWNADLLEVAGDYQGTAPLVQIYRRGVTEDSGEWVGALFVHTTCDAANYQGGNARFVLKMTGSYAPTTSHYVNLAAHLFMDGTASSDWQGFATYAHARSPSANSAVYRCIGAEYNTEERYADRGHKDDLGNQDTVCIQVVPEGTKNASFGITFSPGGSGAKLHTGMFFRANTAATTGEGIYMRGGSVANNRYNNGVRLRDHYNRGINLSEGTYADDSQAILLGDLHKIRFGTASIYVDSGVLKFYDAGTGVKTLAELAA